MAHEQFTIRILRERAGGRNIHITDPERKVKWTHANVTYTFAPYNRIVDNPSTGRMQTAGDTFPGQLAPEVWDALIASLTAAGWSSRVEAPGEITPAAKRFQDQQLERKEHGLSTDVELWDFNRDTAG